VVKHGQLGPDSTPQYVEVEDVVTEAAEQAKGNNVMAGVTKVFTNMYHY
jgi:hypothetical protein